MEEYDDVPLEDIKSLILLMNEKMKAQLPLLKKEVKQLIKSKNTNEQEIERTLDTLLSLAQVGIAEDLFIDLIRYYKTVNDEGADFYWEEYNREEEENEEED